MMKILHEVCLRSGHDGSSREMIQACLVLLGVLPENIIAEEGRAGRKMSVFFPLVASARRLARSLRALKLKGVAISIRMHRQVDWETRWKKGWKPFMLTPRIYVIPLFLSEAQCPSGKTPLYLETTSAFGTGLHETTRFSAGLIEGLTDTFKSFLDIGTGTGILSIVAFRSGARYVEAFDIDAGAVKAARVNLKANSLRCDVLKAGDVGEYGLQRTFDLVAANLITHDLVAFRQKIVASVAPGGHLIISGIALKNMPLVKKAYGLSAGLECVKIIKGKEWCAFLFRRSLTSGRDDGSL